MPNTQSRHAVFLSYNSRDRDFIELLAHKLKDARLLPWFDKWELIPGNRWIGGLADGLYASDTCAVFIGPHNLGDWEAEEIDLAHTRAAKESAFRVIPVLLPGVPDPLDPNRFPPFLKTRIWIDFRKGVEDRRAFHYLKCGIEGTAPGAEIYSASAGDDQISAQDTCPYRGLQVFNEEDAEIYFGRAGDIQRLVEKLKATRFMGVLGASGSGKSSLVRAGLIPRLRAGDLPNSKKWRIVPTFTPGRAPLEELVFNFAKLPSADTGGLLGLLRNSERALHVAVHDFLELPQQRAAGAQRVLIVIDQLEEIFTLCDKESERSQFLANLLYAASVPDGNCVVVVTMRADFYQKCAAYPEFSAELAAQQFLVSMMQHEGLEQAIHEPARHANLKLEPGLVKTIADDVAGQPGALPLLGHALLELWQRRKNGHLTLEGYIDTGRVQGAIAKRADTIYESFSPEEQTVMQRVMLRLTQPGEGTEDTLRRASFDELITRTEDQETVELVVNTLASPEHRLLTIDEKSGVRIVEVSHEALIRGWGTLRKWLDEDREGLRLHRRLSEDANEWKEQATADENNELLYHGLLLARALEWRKRHEAELNDSERKFLYESEALKQRVEEENRARERHKLETALRQRYLRIGFTFLFLMTLAVSFYVYKQFKDSRSREIASKATAVLPNDPLLGILLATEAARTSPTSQAEAALREALIASYGLRNILQGHKNSVMSAVFSPDGKLVVTASDDKTARVWDVATGHTVQELVGHTGLVNRAEFSPDGKWIVTASEDNTARVWDVATWSMHELGHPNSVINAFFSLDSKLIVTASADNTARIWEVATWSMSHELKGHTDRVVGVTFSPDAKWVVTASWDHTARAWDVATGRMVRELTGHTGLVLSPVFSPDGKQLVTPSSDHTARVWDVATWNMVHELRGHTKLVYRATFSPDGKWLVTASDDKTAMMWDVATWLRVRELRGHTGIVYTAVFSHDRKLIVTASDDKTARIWDVATGHTVLELKGHANFLNSAVFSPDDKLVLTASDDTTARIWEASTFRTARELTGDGGKVNSAEFSPNGEWVVTASDDKTARVWDVATGRTARELRGHTGKVRSAVFSYDGKLITTASDDATARVWDVATGAMVQELKEHTKTVFSAAFSPDGRLVVTASHDKTALVWDVSTGRIVQELRGHIDHVRNAVFSPDGRLVLTSSDDRTARIWEVTTGRVMQELKGHTDPIVSSSFSPDANWIVTASEDTTARIWEVATGRAMQELKGHTDAILKASFSPDSKWVVTASRDKTVRLWEAATGHILLELKDHTDSVNSASFSPDGKSMVTASDDKTARIFDCEELGDLESLLDLARHRVQRQLTDQERRLYLNQ